MKGCPHCSDMKNMLKSEGIKFSDRDIDVYEKEYNLFVKATENEYIPAFMLLTFDNPKTPTDITFLNPDKDFNDLPEAVEIVKKYLE